jgi:cobalamin biosynthesis protein CobT
MTPEAAVSAISACTRALGGSATVAGELERASAATVSGLRAIGDRLALRARYHDPRIHHTYRPADHPASDIFDWLELARLDAIGVHWLAGVAKNLMAHPGAEHDGVRWLTFEALSGQSAPPEKRSTGAGRQVRIAGSTARRSDRPSIAAGRSRPLLCRCRRLEPSGG